MRRLFRSHGYREIDALAAVGAPRRGVVAHNQVQTMLMFTGQAEQLRQILGEGL